MNVIEVQSEFNTSAARLYTAWLDSGEHSAFTGGLAAIEPRVGSHFTAWDGYITGIIEELEEGRRILQSWRTSEFPDGAPNSLLEVTFENNATGCVLNLKHWNIPEGQADQYKNGWDEHYFEPMKIYFNNRR